MSSADTALVNTTALLCIFTFHVSILRELSCSFMFFFFTLEKMLLSICDVTNLGSRPRLLKMSKIYTYSYECKRVSQWLTVKLQHSTGGTRRKKIWVEGPFKIHCHLRKMYKAFQVKTVTFERWIWLKGIKNHLTFYQHSVSQAHWKCLHLKTCKLLRGKLESS